RARSTVLAAFDQGGTLRTPLEENQRVVVPEDQRPVGITQQMGRKPLAQQVVFEQGIIEAVLLLRCLPAVGRVDGNLVLAVFRRGIKPSVTAVDEYLALPVPPDQVAAETVTVEHFS